MWNLSGTSVNGLSPDWRSKGGAEEDDDVACPNQNPRVSGDLDVTAVFCSESKRIRDYR